MVTIKQIIEKTEKFADQIDNLTEAQGDFSPWGDIRLRAQWIRDLMKELKKEEHVLEGEIKRDEKAMKYIEHMLR